MATYHFWTDDEIVKVAASYAHKGDWKRSSVTEHRAAYQAAQRRRLIDKACAHMTPKASPYSGSYVVYAYEFPDGHAYVGLTFLPRSRHSQHMCRGPVYDHMKICRDYALKTVGEGFMEPDLAASAEKGWIDMYRQDGWTMLNTDEGGSLGTVHQTKWTKESVLAKAKEFQTRKAWYLGSQFTYGLAKREGWFEAAVAHMPRRVLGIGKGVPKTDEAKEKMRQAKIGVKQSAAHVLARVEGVRRNRLLA